MAANHLECFSLLYLCVSVCVVSLEQQEYIVERLALHTRVFIRHIWM